MSAERPSAMSGPAVAGPAPPPDLPGPARDAPALVIFGILAVLVCLGLMFEAPGLLVVLLILATPALIRTVVASSREKERGAPQSGMTAVGSFLGSLGVVVMVGLASGVAFFATCFAVCLGGLTLSDLNHGNGTQWLLVASVGAGLVPGLAVAIYLFRRFWSRKG